MAGKRRNHSASFKAKVALDAAMEAETAGPPEHGRAMEAATAGWQGTRRRCPCIERWQRLGQRD